MCGRFAFYSPAEAVAAMFGVDDAPPVEPRYNVAPTLFVAAVRPRVDGDGRELVMLRWGLVPFWAKDPSVGNRMINARAETVAEKPAYREAYRRRRCLVLADGYYEWQRQGGTKTPWFVSRADGEPFAFAALWESWRDRDSGDRQQSTAIVTMAANDFLRDLHDRMPVAVDPDGGTRWLQGERDFLGEAAQAMPKLRAWPVSRTVDNARNEGAGLIDADGAGRVQERRRQAKS